MNGVSWLGWCEKCGKEAVTGSNPGDCTYYDHEVLNSWDGEDKPIVSIKQKETAVKKAKNHMLRVLKKFKNLDARDFQGETSVSAEAYYGLLNDGKIEVKDNKVNLKK